MSNFPRAVLAAAAVATAGCSTAARTASTAAGHSRSSLTPAAVEAGHRVASGGTTQTAERLLVRRAFVTLELGDADAAAARIRAIAGVMNGYVEHEKRHERSVQFTLRVPDERLGVTLDTLATLGKVRKRGLNTDDVTSEVVDLDARLVSLVAMRDRLRKLLDRADAIPEVITVERELTRVQEQIDLIEARLKHLRTSAALAEIQVDAREREMPGVITMALQGLGWVIQKVLF